jgi:hypothetical protein
VGKTKLLSNIARVRPRTDINLVTFSYRVGRTAPESIHLCQCRAGPERNLTTRLSLTKRWLIELVSFYRSPTFYVVVTWHRTSKHMLSSGSAELSHSLKVSGRRRITPKSAPNRSESLCAGVCVPFQMFFAGFGQL